MNRVLVFVLPVLLLYAAASAEVSEEQQATILGASYG